MKRHDRLVLLALGLGLAVATPARGDSYLDRSFGTPILGLAPRSAGLGGAAAALPNGVYSLVDNPAALMLEHGSRLQSTGSLARVSENRFVPLFDTFDSYVDDAAIAVNDHQYPSLSGGVVYDPGWKSGVMVAAGIFERYDPRYDFYDERRSTTSPDPIVAERFIRTRGVLRTASLGAAFPVGGRGGVGVAVHRYYGTLSDRAAIVPRAALVSAADTSERRRLSGYSFTFGGTLDATERLRLGLAVETRVRLDNDFTRWENGVVIPSASGSEVQHLPWRLQSGVAYRPRNALRATFAMDVVYTPWSDTDLRLASGEKLQDTWDLRFGVEHLYYNNLPGRIGFRYARSYALRDADRAAFTFGLGYRVERTRIDLSGELGKRNSRQPPLWPRDPQYTAVGSGMDRVEDTLLKLVLGMEVEF